MAQNQEIYNEKEVNINLPGSADGSVRFFRRSNLPRNPPNPAAPFVVKWQDGYIEPIDGAQGATGAQGFQGSAGGPQGFQGDVGAQGFQGDIGTQGFQGDIGAQGAPSIIPGPPGAQGFQGTQGFQGAPSIIPGPPGAQGFQGTTGVAGASATIPYSNGIATTITVATPLFLSFGAIGGTEDANNWVAPRAGTIRNLFITVPTTFAGTTLTFTIRRSSVCNGAFADTAIEVSLSAAGCASDIVDSVAVAAGDRISLRVSSSTLGVSASISGGLEFS